MTDKSLPPFLEHAPSALRARFESFYVSSDETSARQRIRDLRLLNEEIMHHLATAYRIEEMGFDKRKDILLSQQILSQEISPYLDLWWRISCLASHYQKTELLLPWQHHLESCTNAAENVLRWYIENFPVFSIDENEMRRAKSDLSSICADDIESLIEPSSLSINDRMTENCIFLTGSPWIGKTSLVSVSAKNYIDCGYILLPFHEHASPSEISYVVTKNESEKKALHGPLGAQIHQIIATRLFYGNSFVLLFDDPFGHRYFRKSSILSRLDIDALLKLNQREGCLGHLVVLVTSPSELFEEAMRKHGQDQNTVLGKNLHLLRKVRHELSVDDYAKVDLYNIVTRMAETAKTDWAHRTDVRELVADEVALYGSFESLKIFCQYTKDIDDIGIIEYADSFFKTRMGIFDEIVKLGPEYWRAFASIYVGEAIIEISREFRYDFGKIFSRICYVLECEDVLLDQEKRQLLEAWATEDPTHSFGLSDIHVFKHPDIRAIVYEFLQTQYADFVNEAVSQISGYGKKENICLEGWQSIHLVCKLAPMISRDLCISVNQEFFDRKAESVDGQNNLRAVLTNWHQIEGTNLERYAFNFLTRVRDQIKQYTRPMIIMIFENWDIVNEDIRRVAIETNFTITGGTVQAKFNDENIMAYIGAISRNLVQVHEVASEGSEMSQNVLTSIQYIFDRLERNLDKGVFPSRQGDEVFEAPGVRYTGRQIFNQIIEIGLDSGGMTQGGPIAQQIKSKL